MRNLNKQSCFLFVYLIISSFVFAQTKLQSNKQMIVNENLRLRVEENTKSSVIATMGIGTKVKLLTIGKKDCIDGIESNWVKIEVLENGKDRDGNRIKPGVTGWCYGGYLVENIGTIYDSLDLTNGQFKKKELDFKTALDEKAWEKLSGLYFAGKVHQTISVIKDVDTTWGKDYTFGLGCYHIWYENGKWFKGGDGEAETYTLISMSADGKSFELKSDYSVDTTTWTFDGYNLNLGHRKFYKFSGPDCYKHFIKDFVSNHRKNLESVSDYKLGDLPEKILAALQNADINEFSKYIDDKGSVYLEIGDYFGNTRFRKEDFDSEKDYVTDAFNFIKADLKKHTNLLSVKPLINQFVYTTKDRYIQMYPEGEVFLEYSLRAYEEISLVFKYVNNELKLIGVIDYAVFRA